MASSTPLKMNFTKDGVPYASADDLTHFTTHCGLLMRNNVPITATWGGVSEEVKDYIWSVLCQHWNIDENPKAKEVVLKRIGRNFGSWKSTMRKKFVKNKNASTPHPCDLYSFNPDQWTEFEKITESQEFQEKSKKGKQLRALNKYPHTMGSGGYKKAKPKWRQQKAVVLMGENSINQEINPRAMDWILGYCIEDPDNPGVYLLASSEISGVLQRMVEKAGDTSDGQSQASPQDVLTATIGTKEHPGRVRGHSGFETQRTVFGKVPRNRQSRESVIMEMEARVQVEIQARVQTQQEQQAQFQAQQAQIKRLQAQMQAMLEQQQQREAQFQAMLHNNNLSYLCFPNSNPNSRYLPELLLCASKPAQTMSVVKYS